MRASDLPLHYNAVDILERNLAERADKVALLSTERTCTFGEVASEANRVGNALRGLGIGRGDVVGILAPDSAEWVTSFFGITKIGAVALGINTLLKPAELALQLEDSRACLLIAHHSLLEDLWPHLEKGEYLDHIVIIGGSAPDGDLAFAEWVGVESDECTAARTHREDICALNYSSGTTGEPKGIPHAHKDYPLTAQLWAVNVLGLREDDRTFAGAKLFFTFGTGGNLIFQWYVGASCVLLAGSPRDPANVLGTVSEFRPTILYNAPTGYAMALAMDDLTERFDLSSLRLCVSAGEALPAPLWHAWKERTGLDIIDGIGCTENWQIFLSNHPGDIRPGSTGKPFDGYEVKLVDEDGSEITAAAQTGELWVRGETASLSYLRRYADSRRTFRGEWLVTGDKYYRDGDGYFWHAGRADDMLKVGGIWVSPVEVESTLISHAAVLECAVVGEEDDSGLVKPKAFVILNDGFAPSDSLAADLIEHCKSQIAAYKRPRWIEFVNELPKTATGKIQRFRLRE